MKKCCTSLPWCATEAGTVLLTTIIMIGLITVLVMSLMQAVFLYSHLSSRFIIKQNNFYTQESLANHIKLNFMDYARANCLDSDTNPNHSFEIILENGCVTEFEKNKFYYLITDLGEFPCLPIVSDGLIYGSHHWLITVSNEQGIKLQRRIAMLSVQEECQSTSIRFIKEGIISWRISS